MRENKSSEFRVGPSVHDGITLDVDTHEFDIADHLVVFFLFQKK